jgi:dihydroneopterin aldolase
LPDRRRKIGSDYSIDLEIKTDLRKSCLSDDLNDTVDYVLLNKIVVEEMEIHSFTRTCGTRIIRVGEILKFPEYFCFQN